MTTPVPARKVKIAGLRIQNAASVATACRAAGIPFYVALAFVEQESTDGSNIYGHDVGGTNALPTSLRLEVTAANFLAFLVKVMNGARSNGVGPLQITYAGELKNGHRDGGHFRLMAAQGLLPWVPADNMLYGFTILKGLKDKHGTWEKAAAHYNGGGNPNSAALKYGKDVVTKAHNWKARLAA